MLYVSWNPGDKSLSSWRAWIEIYRLAAWFAGCSGRSPHGERGLKYPTVQAYGGSTQCRSPHGERGLKYLLADHRHMDDMVALLMESVD